jgi:hypothetical protein
LASFVEGVRLLDWCGVGTVDTVQQLRDGAHVAPLQHRLADVRLQVLRLDLQQGITDGVTDVHTGGGLAV